MNSIGMPAKAQFFVIAKDNGKKSTMGFDDSLNEDNLQELILPNKNNDYSIVAKTVEAFQKVNEVK